MTKKSDSSWFQFDSNILCTVTHIRKEFVQNWLAMSPSQTILCCACALETYQHNQNFMILVDSRHKIMSEC